MQTLKIISATLLVFSFWGCGPSAEKKRQLEDTITNNSPEELVSSSAAVENGKDSTRKFIRTADLKFKVKSVIESTYDIENITARQGGFVTRTHLESDVHSVVNTPVSADSTLVTTTYIVRNNITLRIPNTKLDSTLKEIAKNIEFLDYRTIEAEDVALNILSNNLTQKRSAKNEQRLTSAIDNRGKKLNETTTAEEVLLSKQEQADNAKIANLSLMDQVKFSTVNLSIYQRLTISRELISNDRNLEAYEPGFGSKLWESIKSGWSMLEAFLVFLVRLWGLFLFIIICYVLYRRFKPKMK